MYWPSVNPRPKNRCVTSFCNKVAKIFISSCVIIQILFSQYLYRVVLEYGMAGAGVLSVPTLGDLARDVDITLDPKKSF